MIYSFSAIHYFQFLVVVPCWAWFAILFNGIPFYKVTSEEKYWTHKYTLPRSVILQGLQLVLDPIVWKKKKRMLFKMTETTNFLGDPDFWRRLCAVVIS